MILPANRMPMTFFTILQLFYNEEVTVSSDFLGIFQVIKRKLPKRLGKRFKRK